MKRNRLITLTLLSVISFFILQSHSGGYDDAEVATQPTTAGCATGSCHNAATQDQVNLSIFMKDANGQLISTYFPGQDYTVEIKMQKQLAPSSAKGGFQSIITNAIGTAVGTFNGSDMPNNVTGGQVSGKQFMMHNTSNCTPIIDLSGVVTWTYKWKAPAFGGGNITIHAIVNDANGDNGRTGDNIVYNTNTVIQGSNVAVNDLAKEIKAIYPNPTTNFIKVDLSSSAKTEVNIFSANGQVVLSKTYNTQSLNIDLSNLSSGNYYMSLSQNGKQAQRPIVKL